MRISAVSRASARIVRTTGILVLTAALGGCALLPGLPPETFNLSAPLAIPNLRGSTNAQILVEEPAALQTYNTERIVVREGAALAYYPLVQWADRLPVLIQTLTIEALANSGRARAAGRPGDGLSIDYAILTEVRAFEYSALTGTADVEIHARIMDDRNGRVVANRTFTAATFVGVDAAAPVVAALDAALQTILAEIVVWTLDTI